MSTKLRSPLSAVRVQSSILKFLTPVARQETMKRSSSKEGKADITEDKVGKSKTDLTQSHESISVTSARDTEVIALLELVWAKYSKYPPWPAIVCLDVNRKLHVDADKIHVQFFDRPVSTAWVPLSCVSMLTGSSLDQSKGQGGRWQKALDRARREAAVALGMNPRQRQKLIGARNQLEEEIEEDAVEESEESEEEDEVALAKAKKRRRVERIRKQDKENVEAEKQDEKKKKQEDVEDEDGEHDCELSEYEMIRQRNISERKKLFQELQILETKSGLTPPPRFNHKRSPSKRGLASARKVETSSESLPMRKSLRLQRIEADTGLVLPDNEPSAFRIPSEDEHPRLPLRDLSLSEVVSGEEDVQHATEFLSRMTSLNLDTPRVTDASFGNNVKKSFASLSINADRVAKVVPDRIFSMAVHPTDYKHLIAAGGKWGGIGLWDIDDLSSETHGVQLFKPHSRPVNCLSFDNFDSTKLVSTSYDGTVRRFDLTAQKFQLLFGEEEDDIFATYHKQLDAHTYLVAMAASDKSGRVGVIDTREASKKVATSFQLYHKVSPKTVDVHPLKRDVFLCPNNKGECATYDIRGTSKREGLALPLLSFAGHTKGLSSAFFSCETGKSICTVSYDNMIRLYCSWAAKEKEVLPYKSIPHNNQTGRWLTTFKAEWHPKRDDLFFVGSMEHPRQIDVFSDLGLQQAASGETTWGPFARLSSATQRWIW